MKVPSALALAFGPEFEAWISEFAAQHELIPDKESLKSPRYLSRSIVPHVQRLSSLFNREEANLKKPGAGQSEGLDSYWKGSSNPQHFRLAYFLNFMPCNLYRIAAVWSELQRLGFRWTPSELQGVEFGAGPATGLCGIAAGEKYSPIGLPQKGTWALIEQDKTLLEWGMNWSQAYLGHLGSPLWNTRPFHRKLDLARGFLPPQAPRFNLWLMSFFLNESHQEPAELARVLMRDWKNHLQEESLIILVEPALRLQSRRLLELRKHILLQREKTGADWLQVLVPCLGHQACGALASPDDWCHEEVTWWRPPYIRSIDKMASLDRKTLPFSYLVLMKSKKTREELLPLLAESQPEQRYRLVSPVHPEGRDSEFFICGQEGKRRARFREPERERKPEPEQEQEQEKEKDDSESPLLQRGSLLLETELRGDVKATRIEKVKKII